MLPQSDFFKNCCAFSFAFILFFHFSSVLAEHNFTPEKTRYKNGNVGFVKNAGQVYDYDKNKASNVLYSLNADNSSIFLTTSGLTYSIIDRVFQNTNPPDISLRHSPDRNSTDKKVVRMDMILLGASILKSNTEELEYQSEAQLAFYGNTIGTEARDLRFCRQVLVRNIYPNIDWLLKITNENIFKYDFIVHPGGDVNDIRLQYNGCSELNLNSTKDQLTLVTPLGNITEGKLYCFTEEDQFPVLSKYGVHDNLVYINTAYYNKNKTLVVDPAIEMELKWSTYYGGGAVGGGGGTVCSAIKCDEMNNRVYVTGYCYSNPFPLYNNNVSYYFNPSLAGSSIEAFISAFDLNGVQKWATFYMSSEYDAAFDVTTDTKGNVYMVGTTESHNSSTINFLTQPLAGSGNCYLQQNNHATPIIPGIYSYQEGFIVRFNKAGQLQWATLLGGDRSDQVYSVACDYNDNVYVAGLTWSASLLPIFKNGSGGYLQSSASAGQNGLIAGFNSSAKLIWCTYFGNAGSDCRTIKCDGNNNIYITGAIGTASGFPFYNSTGSFYSATDGHYVAAFYPSTKRKWCSSFQPGQNITDICINKSDGNILITGYSSPTSTFNWKNYSAATANTFFDNTFNGGDYDGFLAMLRPDFGLEWATLIGGASNDQITSATISNNGKVFISGFTDNSALSMSGNLPVVNPGAPAYFEGNLPPYAPSEIFVSAFTPISDIHPFRLVWSTMFGDDNTGREIPYDMDMSGGNLFMSGNALLEPTNPGFPLTAQQNGFLQSAAHPLVAGFNPSGSNGLIVKFSNYEGLPLKSATAENALTFKIYPNPCADHFMFLDAGSNEFSNAQLSITDVLGREIKKLVNTNAESEIIKIDLEGVAKGYYFLSVSNNGESEKIPFIRF